MASIQDEIAAFKTMQSKLEAEYLGRWVLIYERDLIKVFDSFSEALAEAGERFGNGPYLIRQVGAPPMTLPASVMYRRDAHR
jgi:hypothetical protein